MPSWDDGRDLKPADQRRFIDGLNGILAENGMPATTWEEIVKAEEETGYELEVRLL